MEINAKSFLDSLEKEMKKNKAELYNEERLLELKEIARQYDGEGKVISSWELAEQMKNEPPEPKIMSGYTGLDKILGGFRERQLIVISAKTKSGKTSFCIDLTLKMKEQNPLWFPFEEGARELIQKFIDREEQPPLFYTPEQTVSNTLNWIEMKIIESIAKFNTKIVFLDQLDFIVPFKTERNDLEIGKTMRDLKGLAKKWNVTIFLICHLSQGAMDKQPDLQDLRGSASIAQEADTVILLWRQMEHGENGEVIISNKVNLSVQANRRTGKTGNVKLVYDNGKFLEEDWRQTEPVKNERPWEKKQREKREAEQAQAKIDLEEEINF
jgi:replicative DNA helicase